MAAILVMAAIGLWAVRTGTVSYLVTYGVSMQPTYYAGDLVLIIKSDSYEVGEIAAYHGAGGRAEVLHRIIGGDGANGFVFKGDNNQSIDADKPTADQLIGRAVVHIPKGGVWLQPLLSPTGLGVISFLLVGGGAAAAKTRRDLPRGSRKKRVKGMSGQGGSLAVAAAVLKAISRLHPAVRAVAVLTAVSAVLGVGLGALGWMKPAVETVTPNAGSGESMTFGYSAKVPRSAAYDGTTVYSPEPVFRKVANLVDLQMTYRGQPGQISVSARLSTQSGWHSTMRLSQARQFTADRYTHTVQLDLDALHARAQAASEAIGTELGQLTVDVTAPVRHADGSTFEPTITLAIDPLQMILPDGPSSLVVDRSSTASGPVVQNRQISALGHHLFTAAQARKYAAVLLTVAVTAAVIVAMLALRSVPLRTRAQIQRRYPHLLVPVEPMPSPPGKPVVIVDNFPALVKLAEKYGQMILTWTRPDGADDFVVRDDGVTYRYRIVPPGVTPEPDSKPAPARRPAARKATGTAKVPEPSEAPPAPEERVSPEGAAEEATETRAGNTPAANTPAIETQGAEVPAAEAPATPENQTEASADPEQSPETSARSENASAARENVAASNNEGGHPGAGDLAQPGADAIGQPGAETIGQAGAEAVGQPGPEALGAPSAEAPPAPEKAPQEPAPEGEGSAAEKATEKPQPAKRARRPRKKAAAAKVESGKAPPAKATTENAGPESARPESAKPESAELEDATPEDAKPDAEEKPPLKRPIRRKPQAARAEIESLADLNQTLPSAPADPAEAPIYDFLLTAKTTAKPTAQTAPQPAEHPTAQPAARPAAQPAENPAAQATPEAAEDLPTQPAERSEEQATERAAARTAAQADERTSDQADGATGR
ncbi:DUF5305 family protein [Actinoplanes sp. DH11]|uniref:DUF5305 family protein n=1 Tax=Actinoplanes sp. DH11 TaxID=2857011 RepID=UPI001E55A86A|nr:DUF5305 family protein [Actinoplanes sp. DH11]